MGANYELKIDWLSFTFLPDEEMKESYSNILDCFIDCFPNAENILRDCVTLERGRFGYSSAFAWNDDICLYYDKDNSVQDSLEHGLNVQIASHSLANVYDMFGLDKESSDFTDILRVLFDNHCSITRLDIALDDYTKAFYPEDFDNYERDHKNTYFVSPCNKLEFVHGAFSGEFTEYDNSIYKGSTFYVGARKNKILRVYNKFYESAGEIDSVRYEMEFHKPYCNDVARNILDGSFEFFAYLEKYFFRLTDGHYDSNNRYKNDDLEEWADFKNKVRSSLANNSLPYFPKYRHDVSMEKTEKWIYKQVLPSLVKYIYKNGLGDLFTNLHNVNLSPKDYKIVVDALSILNQSKLLGLNIEKFKFCSLISDYYKSPF